jgi:Leucine-rich repeat (LRR) protein
MKDCKNLQTLPRKLKMDSLEELILSGCTKLKKLPKFEKNMKCLSRLSLEDCKNLLYLPTFICNMKSLKMLNISGCSKVSKLLDNMNENESLNELYVNGTSIREITSSKVCLENLKELSFGGMKEQVSNSRNIFQRISKSFRKQPIPMELILPPLSRLSGLKFLNLSYCYLNDESIPDNLGSISFLQVLDLSGNNFVNPPSNCICNLFMLHSLIITDCTRLESLPILPSNVQCLFTYNCPQLKTLNLDDHMLWQTFESHMNQVCVVFA